MSEYLLSLDHGTTSLRSILSYLNGKIVKQWKEAVEKSNGWV